MILFTFDVNSLQLRTCNVRFLSANLHNDPD
jgi:hypothetical protein